MYLALSEHVYGLEVVVVRYLPLGIVITVT